MYFGDYHNHSRYSFDGSENSSIDALCARAVELGMTDLCITDHCDVNGEVEGIYRIYDSDAAYADLQAAREKYKDKLYLSFGIELGQANQYPDYARMVLARHKYDFVIGSLHNLTHVPDFFMIDFSKVPLPLCAQLFNRTLDEIMEIADFGCIDTIGHITYQERYMARAGINYDFRPHYDKLEALFAKLIRKDIAIEVNTSTLWHGLDFPMPNREILKLYADCGGKLMTIGSDAHSPVNLGKCIKEGLELLESVGLHEIMVVRDGKKTLLPINGN